ncbi:MAG TPA: PilZ domain-containing protein [Candidatus Acidoferrales bacterium]|nr:PilZ domain-containing protein [Candidatus Acidoferrales bacterium]
MTSAERRQAYRLHLQVPMFMRGTDAYGEDFVDLAKTLDISAGGAYLTSPRALAKAALITLTVPAPSVSNSGLVPASMAPIQARVLRQKEVGDVHLIGVQFLKPLD